MVKFSVRSTKTGQYYLPKEVRQELGQNLSLICNAQAAVIFNENTKLSTVIESVQLITKDLEHRLSLQKEQKT